MRRGRLGLVAVFCLLVAGSLCWGQDEAVRVGFQKRTYVSEIDGASQPYLLYVPSGYDAQKRWPLLIFLHGYASDLSRANWADYMYSPTLERVCEREGVILLLPFGRSNTEFMGIGESDVLKTIGLVRAEFSVDPDRILLSGASMGGSGAYSIACHRSDMFACVMVITARVDYYLWQRIAHDALPVFKRAQIDADYALELLENLAHVPVLEFHGDLDRGFAAQARRMKSLCDAAGVSCEVVEFKGEGHYIWSRSFEHPNFIRMLRDARRVKSPRKVALNTFTLKHAKSHWVRIERIVRWGEKAVARAEVGDGNVINLVTANVGAVALGPDIPGVANPARVRVVSSRKVVGKVVGADGVIRLEFATRRGEKDGLRKSPVLCGPIREAYDGPFVIVCGTLPGAVGDGERKSAVRIAREWMAYAKAVPRIMADGRVTDEQVAKYNLIIIGSPETNQVFRRMADKLPIRIEKDEYVLGKRRFPLQGNGLQFIFPNPLNPKRYVVIIHGAAWAPKVQANHKLDFLPDFIVYSDKTVNDGTWFPTNGFLCAGYFDGNWRFAEESTWVP